MAKLIALNKMTDTMKEGVLVKWSKKKGDTVKPGDILAEVETDKATMDLENFESGTLLELLVPEGTTVPIGGAIAVLGNKGEDFSALLASTKSNSNSSDNKNESKPAEEKKAATTLVQPSTQSHQDTSSHDGRLKASPLAKKMASDKGIDINAVIGSGEGGRIIKKDIENYTPAINTGNASFALGKEGYTEVTVSQMRKTIAARLAESKFSAPHFYLTMEIEMDNVLTARERINANGDVKISVNDIIVKAVAMALRKHPQVNSSWLGDKIRTYQHIHVGVAVAVDEGLLVPVVRFADQKPLSAISAEVKEFGKKAKEKKLQPQDWAGNTFTVSNLGMFGIEEFTAIINPPDACILAVGSVKDTVAIVEGKIIAKKVMKVTLSCDHRVVDGVVGSKFLQTFKGYMEDPIKMLV
ncbi:MAG: pyruvate dehydrogenase complex dihydrolipoamide acetyltransferase [Bacteroidia bacterium]|nr:pyruvate dehydrogenase complex dihydrolipoamide acetyltransferase [Bacteroidia bacterium]